MTQHNVPRIPYISLPENVPGIRSLVMFRPETGKPLYQLVEILLRGESGLSAAERELIAASVSAGNECVFCSRSHAAAARCLFDSRQSLVDDVLVNDDQSQLRPAVRALLHIAAKVRVSGKNVLQEDVDQARMAGASDRDIHDAVLIAATFSMFNRYVDGLNTLTPGDEETYANMGVRMAGGYAFPTQTAFDSK